MGIKLDNVTSNEHCSACDDTGWVELAGTETHGGVEYSRGMAPCKWCDLGTRRFLRANDPAKHGGRWEPRSDFDGTDIIPHDDPTHKFTPDADFLRERAATGIPIDALKAMFPQRIWPSEWPSSTPKPALKPMPRLGDNPTEITRKQQAARIAARQVEAEAQTSYDLADLPF